MVGSAVFCEPCLIAKLSGAGNPVGAPIPGEIPPPPPPPPPDEPNPGLAALLGFIPGVGAMYNGQYAKGIVHLIVFAILVSLAGENGIFGLFIAGWVFYQVIEAHHTAQARRDGTPLPNPFGLNDLGERLGFGKAWPAGSNGRGYGPGAAPSPDATTPPAAGYTPPAANYPPPPSGYQPPPNANWGAPWDNYVPPVPPASPFVGQQVPPSNFNPASFNPADFSPAPRNRFPTGAVWLILLGALFLIGNSGIFHGFAMHLFVPLLLIGFGVWQFVHKMTETGTLADDGTSTYKFRIFHASRSAIWIILVGVLFLLDSSHILSWGRSWPLFIIVAGVMAVLQRAAFSSMAAPPAYSYPAPPVAAPPPSSATSVVSPDSPSNTRDEEGR